MYAILCLLTCRNLPPPLNTAADCMLHFLVGWFIHSLTVYWCLAPLIAGTRSSWLNCALRDDEAVYWFSVGHYEAVAVGN